MCAKAGQDWGSFFWSGMSLETKLPDLVVLLLLQQYPPGAPLAPLHHGLSQAGGPPQAAGPLWLQTGFGGGYQVS